MEKNDDVCKNCAYAAVRTDLKRFAWCKYICTCPEEEKEKHFAYRRENDTCKSFMASMKPQGE